MPVFVEGVAVRGEFLLRKLKKLDPYFEVSLPKSALVHNKFKTDFLETTILRYIAILHCAWYISEIFLHLEQLLGLNDLLQQLDF